MRRLALPFVALAAISACRADEDRTVPDLPVMPIMASQGHIEARDRTELMRNIGAGITEARVRVTVAADDGLDAIDLDAIRHLIGQKYPNMKLSDGRYDFRDLALDSQYESDDLVTYYFQNATYEVFAADNVILRGDIYHMYLDDLDGLWEAKVFGDGRARCNGETPQCLDARDNLRPFGRSGPGFEGLMDEYGEASLDVDRNLYRMRLDTPFSHLIDEDMIFAISVNELSPREFGNTQARVAVLRALLDEGLEINKIPSMFDHLLSFGIGQMTATGFDDVKEFGWHFTPQIPSSVEECVSVRDQARVVALMMHRTMRRRSQALQNSPEFIAMFNATNEVEQRLFLMRFVSAFHHNPTYSLRAMRYVLGEASQYESLPEFGSAFSDAVEERADADRRTRAAATSNYSRRARGILTAIQAR